MTITMPTAKLFFIVRFVLCGDATVDRVRDDLVDHQAVVRKGLLVGGPI